MEQDKAIRASYRQASFATWVCIGGNVVLGVAKLIAGIVGMSEALVADGAESLSDSLASLLVVFGLRTAGKPADAKHRYGHGKAEFVAAQAIGTVLLLAGLLIGYRGISEIVCPSEGRFPKSFTIWFVVATIVGKEAMFQYKIRVGRRLKSESLIADAWHHRSDAITSIPALVGIGVALLMGPEWRIFDPLAAVVVGLIICGMGVYTFLRAGSALMDEAADGETLAAIRRIAAAVPGVKDTEKLMTRRSGLETHTELHVEVDPAMAVRDAHEVARRVEQAIRREVPGATHVTVHIEPYYPDDHETASA